MKSYSDNGCTQIEPLKGDVIARLLELAEEAEEQKEKLAKASAVDPKKFAEHITI